jgi:hypothetical protein
MLAIGQELAGKEGDVIRCRPLMAGPLRELVAGRFRELIG